GHPAGQDRLRSIPFEHRERGLIESDLGHRAFGFVPVAWCYRTAARKQESNVRVSETVLPGVLLIEPAVFGDDRGYFLETWAAARYREHGVALDFIQDNVSKSRQGTLRGLHLQHPHA